MSLQGIIEKIQAETETEVSVIVTEADKKRADIEAEALRRKKEIEDLYQTKLEKEQSHRRSVNDSLLKQQISVSLQSVKRELLDEVYQAAFTELVSLSSTEYVDLLTQKYKAMNLPTMTVTTIVAPQSRLSETEEISKSFGWTGEVQVDEAVKAGCILKGENFEYDLSLARLFKESQNNTETEIAGLLFK